MYSPHLIRRVDRYDLSYFSKNGEWGNTSALDYVSRGKCMFNQLQCRDDEHIASPPIFAHVGRAGLAARTKLFHWLFLANACIVADDGSPRDRRTPSKQFSLCCSPPLGFDLHLAQLLYLVLLLIVTPQSKVRQDNFGNGSSLSAFEMCESHILKEFMSLPTICSEHHQG